jgi:hypothetical protein
VARNKFTFKSFLDDVEKDLLASERRVIRKAGNAAKKEIIKQIDSKGIIDEGDLRKSVGVSTYQHAAIVGAGFPAIVIEYGSEERVGKDGHKSGRMKPNEFMLPAFRLATPKAVAIMSKEW